MWLKCLILMSVLLITAVFLKASYLAVLLCLEALVIVSVLVLVHHSELMFSVCFICIGACESAVGLACLVSLVRLQGGALSLI
uniref:NADH dehydrogenase subunit 4L n=1 Tax=Parasagitta elegans TaxID=1562708 RepID=A0A141CLH5_9BILA|nr:NADH dehydrogenase subunit 4L [Parasagitta elegans]